MKKPVPVAVGKGKSDLVLAQNPERIDNLADELGAPLSFRDPLDYVHEPLFRNNKLAALGQLEQWSITWISGFSIQLFERGRQLHPLQVFK
jgi:hypothetical protein